MWMDHFCIICIYQRLFWSPRIFPSNATECTWHTQQDSWPTSLSLNFVAIKCAVSLSTLCLREYCAILDSFTVLSGGAVVRLPLMIWVSIKCCYFSTCASFYALLCSASQWKFRCVSIFPHVWTKNCIWNYFCIQVSLLVIASLMYEYHQCMNIINACFNMDLIMEDLRIVLVSNSSVIEVICWRIKQTILLVLVLYMPCPL